MPFKLIVHPLDKEEAFEKSFRQASVLIGRDVECDLVLRDLKNRVSREHAMIQEKEAVYCLTDLRSKNKTKLNGRILMPKKAYPLEESDEIRIGDFKLTISAIQISVKTRTVEAYSPPTRNPGEGAKRIRSIVSGLCQVFDEYGFESTEKRQVRLLSILRKAVSDLDAEEGKALLNRIESSFQDVGSQGRKITHTQREKVSLVSEPEAVYRKAYDGLLKIAGAYLDETEPVKTNEGMDQFVMRIDKVLSVMFASLSNALKGRRQFEQEFDVEATRILSWRFNPVKECESGEKIGAYLFDWQKEPSIEKGIDNLEEGFNDLALHHLGLIAGLNECLRGLLDQLLPDTFEVDSQGPQAAPMWLRPFIRFEPFRSWAAWKKFRKKYSALREEEVKTFETILRPYIARGYLSVQKKKPAP
ncbi:MAG: type VI secretion system-associated FHA domain protein [Nitrospiria bacterium]